ncbi:MAG TPA: UrcA family protein [Steroidobacteraceae bacterium]|nr:UrcA family protein [Steroidobacteraceae bacterium]
MITRKSTHRSVPCAAAVASLVCVLGSTAAPATAANATQQLHVAYSDLNMNSVAGATTLYNRIRGAARFVCGDKGRRWEEQRHWNECYRGAVADAVATVNSPLLTTLHHGGANVSAIAAR